MSYILSNDNRFYVAIEQSYGAAATIAPNNRIPAVKLTTKQQNEKAERKDKTGSRSFAGNPSGIRRQTSFELTTYMTNWPDQTAPPSHGPFFQAGFGSAAMLSAGGTVSAIPDASKITFSAAHGLVPGQAVVSGAELRFVSAIVDTHTIQMNAPLTVSPGVGAVTGATAVYQPTTQLPSVTVFDYWSPVTAVQRVLTGAAVDKVVVKVNGDFHQFTFTGQAQDLIDSSSFQSSQGALSAYPAEPAVGPINYSIIPGHLGQVWMGSAPDRFFTLTDAQLTFENNLELRAREFGASLPLAIAPGLRSVTLDFSVYQLDDAATSALYQGARQKSPMSVMIQLGQQQGQLFGIYMPSVVPEVPAFDDSQIRQQWKFQSCRAQGSIDNEVFVAFG